MISNMKAQQLKMGRTKGHQIDWKHLKRECTNHCGLARKLTDALHSELSSFPIFLRKRSNNRINRIFGHIVPEMSLSRNKFHVLELL